MDDLEEFEREEPEAEGFGPDPELDEFEAEEPETEESELEPEIEEFGPEPGPEEFEPEPPGEDLPARRSWLPLAASCLFGSAIAAAIAGANIGRWPRSQQVKAFFALLLVLAPLCTLAWYWLFHLRPNRLARKLHEESEQRTAVDSKPIDPA